MPFNQKLQKFNAKINTVTIGSGDKTVTIGGDSTYPFVCRLRAAFFFYGGDSGWPRHG